MEERIDRFFDKNPVRYLRYPEQRAMNWARTDCASLAELHFQYVQRHISHWIQLSRLLEFNPEAGEVIHGTENFVFIGPGFGVEIDVLRRQLKNPFRSNLIAVERNPNAHPVLAFENDALTIKRDISDVSELSGTTCFIGVHLLAQPSLSNDSAMGQFTDELLRVAPTGFSFLSTLPLSWRTPTSLASVSNGFNSGRMPSDEILVAHLRERCSKVTMNIESGPCPWASRLTVISAVK